MKCFKKAQVLPKSQCILLNHHCIRRYTQVDMSRFSLRAESPARAVHSNDSSSENSGEVNLGARSLGKRSRAIAASVKVARDS